LTLRQLPIAFSLMASTPHLLRRAARPAIVLALVFAQGVAAFGFPFIQTRRTVKACGCTTPCGAASENCCCTKALPQPTLEPKRSGCPKCRSHSAPETELTSNTKAKVTWVAGFKARQCRGENPASSLAESPALPPAANSVASVAPIVIHVLTIIDANVASYSSSPVDPPPRRS
jgi:hypothetical protein